MLPALLDIVVRARHRYPTRYLAASFFSWLVVVSRLCVQGGSTAGRPLALPPRALLAALAAAGAAGDTATYQALADSHRDAMVRFVHLFSPLRLPLSPLSPLSLSDNARIHAMKQLAYEGEEYEAGSGAEETYVALGLRFSNVGAAGGKVDGGDVEAARAAVEEQLRRYWTEMMCR